MKKFYDDNVLLTNETSKHIYEAIKNLPIVDYHCHLDPEAIATNPLVEDIGKLWMGGDHYKWRAMRLNGVEEKYITGDASYKEKFIKYASIMPNLIGNPLYYWSHLELKEIFGINEPLNESSALSIYENANKIAKDMHIRDLFKRFNVKYVCTTDDPTSDLKYHGTYDGVKILPTFRPDKLFRLSEEYLNDLAKSANKEINDLDDLLSVINSRLDFFVSKGAVISDQSFEYFPSVYPTIEEARALFIKRDTWKDSDYEAFLGFMLTYLAKEYKKRDMTMQIHFDVTRNVNSDEFKACGPDTGFDIISNPIDIKNVIKFLNNIKDEERPNIILYTLNDENLKALACLTGAFRNVSIGPAWWFNDTVLGIKHNLNVIAEYSFLGNNMGMLTDSRSFASYVRFDLFRRVLASYIGELVENGEYDENSAIELATNISYKNANKLVKGE